MRLLSLRLKNLNSLEGEWLVDFTHPDYEAQGLFAITGPTGSGKSTLLDAVSLALFGRTPRLDRISASQNDIMSRHTGECFAEVCFETDEGQFRAHWAQHRARKQPQGELQSPRHELAKIECGTVLAHQLRRVASEVERLTGMDFDRFTRSMLLAQGNFAAFLQADADQRAPILEQITGTAIYSDLSILAHERYSAEKKTLQDLMQSLDQIELLSPEQEQQMQQELEDVNAALRDLDNELSQYRAIRHALEKREQLQQNKRLIAQQVNDLEYRKQTFSAAAQRLKEAEKAAQLEKKHYALTAQRTALQQVKAKQHALMQRLPPLQQQLDQCQATCERTEEDVQRAETALQTQRPVFQQARALDGELQRLDKELRRCTEQKQQLTAAQQTERQRLEDSQKQLQQTQAQHDKVKQYLDHNQQDRHLSAELGAMLHCADYVDSLQIELKKKKGVLQQAQERRNQLDAQHQDLVLAQAKNENQLQQALDLVQQNEHNWQALTQNRSLAQWQEQLDAQKVQYNRATALMEFALEAQTWQHHQRLRQQRMATLIEQEQQTQHALDQALTVVHSQEQAVHALERLLASEQRIMTMEHERALLEQDTPCPLCGSTDHPWADKAITPPIAQTQHELNQATQQLQRLQQQVQTQRDALHRTQGQLHSEQAQAKQEQQQQTQRMQRFAERHGLDTITLQQQLAQPEALQHALQQAKEAWQHTERQLAQITTLDTALLSAKQALMQQEQIDATTRLKVEQCHAQRQEHAQRVAECQHDVDQLVKRVAQEQEKLVEACQPYGLKAEQRPADFIAELQIRQQRWETQLSALQQCRDQLQQLTLNHKDQQAHYKQVHQQLQQLEQTVEQLTHERHTTQKTRYDLFGHAVVEQRERELEEQLKTDHALHQAAQKAWQELHSRKTHTQEALEEQNGQVETLSTALTLSETRFLEALLRIGFSSEQAYEQALIPLEEREDLARQQQQLITDAQLLQSQDHDVTQQLSALTAQLGAQDTEQVHEKEQALREDYDIKQQLVGQLSGQLTRNQQQKQKTAAHQQIVAQQKKELEKWSQLRELIGSADGKKFRNFAQGLTFDRMVHHANQQLERMQDRYLLLRHPTEPLVLSVIDNYQAGEVRSTKNLSGGESFLISLALALGLSHMASQNVRLDSLFLDEGFGTLDEDALDIALDTLSSLYQEGKTIGVISHVPALKERIATQIQVHPLQGGRSRLEGPGCERIA